MSAASWLNVYAPFVSVVVVATAVPFWRWMLTVAFVRAAPGATVRIVAASRVDFWSY